MGEELAIPGTGELVDLSDTPACVAALDALRNYESLIREAKATLTRAVIEEATRQGVRSIELPDGSRAEVSPPSEIVWDAELLEDRLREAGMPEERISQIVEQTVMLKVKTVEAKKAAAANPEYASAVEEARSEQPKAQYVSIRRKP
jgi:hypothetical protein